MNTVSHRCCILLILFITSMTGCSVVEPPSDTFPPSLNSYTPSSETALIDHETAIVLRFSEPIRRKSISVKTFSLRYPNDTVVPGRYEFADHFEEKDIYVIFYPTSPLPGSTTFYATVTSGITDVAGNHLTNDTIWSFTTAPDGIGTWRTNALTTLIDGRDSLFSKSVWTGSEMLIWGGESGYRYNPVSDTVTPISQVGAPSYRTLHTAVWTGTEMLVWGGTSTGYGWLNDGGRYDPATDTWTTISSVDAPTARASHTAVWTGSEMLIWGGRSGGFFPDAPLAGARYDPVNDTWTTMSTVNSASGRNLHTAIWTGTEMLVWGWVRYHYSDRFFLNNGGRYDPTTDTWQLISATGAPGERALHSAVWTGSEMIIWGGATGDWSYTGTGGRYDPVTDSWTTTADINDLMPRYEHSAVWTGNAMLIWGGYTGVVGSTLPRYGGLYYPATDSWLYTATLDAPVGRTKHVAEWTGNEMIVWGGNQGLGDPLGGGSYMP